MASTQHISQLYEWFEDSANKSFLSDAVVLKKSPLGGVGVFAKRRLNPNSEQDALLLRVSKSSLLSGRTSCISNLLYDSGISGAHALVLSFIYEKSLGEKSPWFRYIQSIDYHSSSGKLIVPPFLWDHAIKDLLKGTEADILGITDPAETQQFFMESIAFAQENSKITPIPFELDVSEDQVEKFMHFAAISVAVASRSFEIDSFHQVALVPGADLFNHASPGQEEVHFETIGDVCPFCGRSDECGHLEHGPPDSEMEVDDIDSLDEMRISDNEQEMEDDPVESVDGPTEITMDMIASLEKGDGEEDSGNSEEGSDDDWDEESLVNPDDCCDIVLTQRVAKNQEVLNTYGNLSNPILLSRYGFVYPENPCDYVSLGIQAIRMRKGGLYAEGFTWWENEGFSAFKQGEDKGCCEEDECDDECDDDDEDEDEEISWELNLSIDSRGLFSPSCIALANVLSMSAEDAEELDAIPEESLPETLKQLSKKPSLKAKGILKSWCESRLAQYNDNNAKARDYVEKLKKKGLSLQRVKVYTILLGEKRILQRAIKSL